MKKFTRRSAQHDGNDSWCQAIRAFAHTSGRTIIYLQRYVTFDDPQCDMSGIFDIRSTITYECNAMNVSEQFSLTKLKFVSA